MPDLTALADEIERANVTGIRAGGEGIKLRDGRDGVERYDVIGHPCGFPVATFGDFNDAHFFQICHNHRLTIAAALRAKGRCSMSAGDLVERLRGWLSYFAELQDYMYVGVADDIAEATTLITTLRAGLAAAEAREAKMREAMERAALIVDRNLYHQSEKVEDAPRILRATLERPAP